MCTDQLHNADFARNANELLLELVVVVAAAVVALFPNANVELEAMLVVVVGTDGLPNEPKVAAALLESACVLVFFFEASAPKVKAEENEGLAVTESVVVVGAMVVLAPNENVDGVPPIEEMAVGAVVTPNDGSDVDDEDDVVVGPNDDPLEIVDLVTSGALKLIVDGISDELVVVEVALLLPKLKFIGAAGLDEEGDAAASEILVDGVTVSVLDGLRPKLKPEVVVLDDVVEAATVVVEAGDNGDTIDIEELFDVDVVRVVGVESPNVKLLFDASGTEITGNSKACVVEIPEPELILGTSNVVLFSATL